MLAKIRLPLHLAHLSLYRVFNCFSDNLLVPFFFLFSPPFSRPFPYLWPVDSGVQSRNVSKLTVQLVDVIGVSSPTARMIQSVSDCLFFFFFPFCCLVLFLFPCFIGKRGETTAQQPHRNGPEKRKHISGPDASARIERKERERDRDMGAYSNTRADMDRERKNGHPRHPFISNVPTIFVFSFYLYDSLISN